MNDQEYAVQVHRGRVRKGKTHLELSLVWNCGQQQRYLQVYHLQKQDKGECGPAAEWDRGSGNRKAEVPVFSGKASLQEPHALKPERKSGARERSS